MPDTLTNDPLWSMKVYRLAVFATDIGWHDVTKPSDEKRTKALSDQLYRALGSVSSSIAEGYSRGTGRDRARFYEYALGSARESRNWYYAARHVFEDRVTDHRMELMTEIIRLLLGIIPRQRRGNIREERASYESRKATGDEPKLESLLHNVPLAT